MRILLVYSLDDVPSPRRPLRSFAWAHGGLSSISAMLKERGHETRLVVLGSEWERRSLRVLGEAVADCDPALVGFTAVATQYPFIARAALSIKERWPGRFLLIGGPHASLDPGGVIQDCFDAVCVGEGEDATLELVGQMERGRVPTGIPNLWIKGAGGRIERNGTRPFLSDLDSLPLPDRRMWHSWLWDAGDGLTVALGRGCPFDCAYCSNHALRKTAGGPYVRTRSPESVARELLALRRDSPATRHVYFEIESIALDREWLSGLCGKLDELNRTLAPQFWFGANLRIAAGAIDDDLFAAMRRAGFRYVNIGLESGSERLRREVLKRDYSNEEFLRAAALAKKHGLDVFVYNMIGVPGETPADHAETVRLNRLVQPRKTFTSIFYPYPGTELHALCARRGLLGGLDPRMERRQAALDLPDFPRREVEKALLLFPLRVYGGNISYARILWRTFLAWAAMRRANYLLHAVLYWSGLDWLLARVRLLFRPHRACISGTSYAG